MWYHMKYSWRKEHLGRWGFVHPERLRIDGMTKTLKQTRQLTGFPGNPNARIFFALSDVWVVISANVRGFPGLIVICIEDISHPIFFITNQILQEEKVITIGGKIGGCSSLGNGSKQILFVRIKMVWLTETNLPRI